MMYILYVSFFPNNIAMVLASKTNEQFKMLKSISSGQCGLKAKQKKTPFACLLMLKNILSVYDIKIVSIVFKQISSLKIFILKFLIKNHIKIKSITEKIPYAYNGCKCIKKYLSNNACIIK